MLRADWLPAADLKLHPAGRRSLSRTQRSVGRSAGDPRHRDLPHTHTHTQRACTHECALRPCASAAAATCRLHLKGTERGSRTTQQCVHTALCATAGHSYFCALLGGNRLRACHHHGLPFSPDMDVTHPARWLHLGSAPVHPVVLEYHQGMWHIHFDVHSLHSVSRIRPVLDQSKQTVEDNLFPQHGSGRTSLSLIVLKKSDKYLSTHIKLTSQLMFQQAEFHLLTLDFHFCQCLQPVATCSFIFFFFFCRRCTFTAHTPPTSSRPAILPAGAPD